MPLLALLKHPLPAGRRPGGIPGQVRALDRLSCAGRGPIRPDGIAKAITRALEDARDSTQRRNARL